VESFAGVTAEVQDLRDGGVPDLNRMRVSPGEVLTEAIFARHRHRPGYLVSADPYMYIRYTVYGRERCIGDTRA
jgi:hypothetical protein